MIRQSKQQQINRLTVKTLYFPWISGPESIQTPDFEAGVAD